MKWLKNIINFLSQEEVRELIEWLLDWWSEDDGNDTDKREIELMKKRIELSKNK